MEENQAKQCSSESHCFLHNSEYYSLHTNNKALSKVGFFAL